MWSEITSSGTFAAGATGAAKTYTTTTASGYRFQALEGFEDGAGGIDFILTVNNSATWQVRDERPVDLLSRSDITSDPTLQP